MDLSKQTLLVIAPHPDDEVLTCGGLIKKIKNKGGKVYVLFLTNGYMKDFSEKGFSSQDERKKEIEKVAHILEIDGWKIAFPGNDYHMKLDTIPQIEIITNIEKGDRISIEEVRPTIIATTQHADYNQDHRATNLAVLSATRPAPKKYKHRTHLVIGYEFTATVNWGPEPFLQRNLYIPLTRAELDAKKDAMASYTSQVREGPHTRNLDQIEYLARVRGASCGEELAESYHIYRHILA